MRAIRALVSIDAGLTTEKVTPFLPQDPDIDIVGAVEGVTETSLALENTPCDILLVACAGYSDRALFLIENAVRQDPKRPVLVLSDGGSAGFVRRVFEVGADDIVMLPQTRDTIAFAIHKAIARNAGGARRDGIEPARLIVVLGPKGGTGKTITATNLAVALQERGKKVVIVDLDLQFGDVALCMGLPPGKTIHDLATSGRPLDADMLDDYLVEHSSGVKALLAPSRPDHASTVSVELIRDIYGLLRQKFDVVVVDTPPGFTAEVIASIDLSTDLVVVGMLDSLSLKNTKLGLETLELMGYENHRVKLVLNRAHTRVGITPSDVSAVLGRDPEILVPSDREIPRAVNEGVPIVLALPRSEAAEAFSGLASFYLDRVPHLEDLEANGAGETKGFRVFRRKS
jgi:pilus assembly protein CpaE